MNPLNLKELFEKKYRIVMDEASKYELGGKNDPWYFIIPCKHGNIFPHSSELLGFYCISKKIRNRLRQMFPDCKVRNLSENGEAIFLFSLEQFELIAEYARPKMKPGPRRLTECHRQKLLNSGRGYQFKPKFLRR